MLIVDGHQSRLDPKFVAYINNKAHEWRVCLGVPYATLTIGPTDIIPLVNRIFHKSYGSINSNLKARRILLLFSK